MYLKKLELIGFKSFAEKTHLNYEPGIAAIVGPNGCGKTNIVDSIKWVLGEQSAKSLRGSKMEDVIFHGTEDRKGIGMAEVSLTFDNSQKVLPLEFNEVTITRRVFRSGESQYYINKNLCRLKDIDNLFMDTGVGVRAYSIFEQGKMDLILSSKPEDRRFIFEEAAGITKYKERKRETLHKIENTENNLIRLNDIIKEVQRQLKAIERQAAKARRYKKLKGELQNYEVKILVNNLRKLENESLEFEKDKLLTEQEVIKTRELINAKEERLHKLQEDIRQLDAEMISLQDEKLSVEKGLVGSEHQIEYKKNKIQEIKKRNVAIESEIDVLEEEIAGLEEGSEKLAWEYEKSCQGKQECKGRMEKGRNEIVLLEHKCKELEKEINVKKESLVGETARQAHVNNDISKLKLQRESLILQEKKEHVELGKKKREKERVFQEWKQAENVLNAQQKALLEARQKIKDHEEKVILLRDEVKDVNRMLKDKQQYFVEKRSEYEMYAEQKKIFANHNNGLKTILDNKDGFPGIAGLVRELISVPEGQKKAINSVLGPRADWLVADTLINAYRAAAKLSVRGLSQVTFLVLERLPEIACLRDHKSGVPAMDVIVYDKEYDRLARFLLGRVLIAGKIKDSPVFSDPAVSRQGPVITVAEDGVVLNPRGIVSGGDVAGDLVARWQAIREVNVNDLKSILSNVSAEIFNITEKYNKSKERLLQEEAYLEAARNSLYKEKISFSIQEEEFLKNKDKDSSLDEEIETLEFDIEEEAARQQELEEDETAQARELQSLNQRLKSIYHQVDQLDDLLKRIQERKQKEEHAYIELKVLLVGVEEKENLVEFKKTGIQQQVGAKRTRVRQLADEQEENKKLAEELSGNIIDIEANIGEYSEKGNTIAGTFDNLQTGRKKASSEVKEIEEALRQERQAADNVYSRLNQKQMKFSEVKLKIDSINRELHIEHKMVSDSIMNISLEGVVISELEEEIAALRERIDKMGEVSMMAIEEQDALAERYEFLTTQRQDLVNAKETLLKAIAKLNSTTRKMFWEAFNQIRENFKNMFLHLFGGGKADLILIDESDVLESGIDIIARPPGKRLQNVSLLSGGEKALTAIALLFAIFKMKPSPFCIMDEIDAPLDDSNINRFVELLKEFATISQFMIITHNKRTISAARSLYGITMEKSGISKVVSVKFNDNCARAAVLPYQR